MPARSFGWNWGLLASFTVRDRRLLLLLDSIRDGRLNVPARFFRWSRGLLSSFDFRDGRLLLLLDADLGFAEAG